MSSSFTEVEAEAEVSSLSSTGVEMSSGLQVGSYGLESGDGDGVLLLCFFLETVFYCCVFFSV